MSELTDKKFCDLYNTFTGEGGVFSGIDNPKQLTVHYDGYELKEWTEFIINHTIQNYNNNLKLKR